MAQFEQFWQVRYKALLARANSHLIHVMAFGKRSYASAMAEWRRGAGKQFDKEIIKICIRQGDRIFVAYEYARMLKLEEIWRRF